MADLASAARELEALHGLASLEGGRHPGWGTANRIVPLGGSYLELLAVVDQAEAEQSAFGRRIAAAGGAVPRPLGWAVRTERLDDVASRLGLTVGSGSRAEPSGRLLIWRSAGVERSAAEQSLPFFIEWGRGARLPGEAPISHPAGAVRLSGLQIQGDADQLAAWLGEHRLPVAIQPGAPAVVRILLAGDHGEIVLGEG